MSHKLKLRVSLLHKHFKTISGTTKKQKNPKLPKGYFGSTDAYMLVYVAENHRPSMEEVKLSDKLQSFVDERTSFYDSLWADIKANKVI